MLGRAILGSLIVVTGTAITLNPFKHWSANLKPVNESTVRGTAYAMQIPGDSLALNIEIAEARQGDAHPWHLHAGGCGGSGAILGDASRYPVLRIGPDRKSHASVNVGVVLDPAQAYSVNVHWSATDPTAISCGDLKPVTPP